MSYRKTGTEVRLFPPSSRLIHILTSRHASLLSAHQWEILGDLALRLHHKEEAKDAYQRCLDSKFSAKAWQKLLETYADEGDLQKSLNAATRLTAYNYR
jgi:predicted negative regulator of RcsB-dependent stress response